MARIPAICENCNTIFPSGVNLGNSARNISFVNCLAGPCPNCGGSGRILDGVYNAVGNAIEAFVGQQRIDDLKQLLEVLREGKRHRLEREEIITNIKQTTPEMSKLGDCLPKTRMELYTFIGIIIAIIGMLIACGKKYFTKDELTQHTEVTISNYYEPGNKTSSVAKPNLPIKDIPISKKRVGRNDPCTCGSGKKYKKCCGR